MLLVCLSVKAQDVQFHYDFGRSMYKAENTNNGDRGNMTVTYENFSADNWGSWYYFVDFDFYNKGMKGAYTEISRELNFWKESKLGWLSAHFEYNGGLCVGRGNTYGSMYQPAMLVGPAYNGHSKDFSKTWSVQAMYKRYFKGFGGKAYDGWQLTGVWSTTFAHQALTFSGFADLWYDDRVDGSLIFLSEPQLWFNFKSIKGLEASKLSIGTEVEISNNFVASKNLPVWNDSKHQTFFVNPTLALKWSF